MTEFIDTATFIFREYGLMLILAALMFGLVKKGLKLAARVIFLLIIVTALYKLVV